MFELEGSGHTVAKLFEICERFLSWGGGWPRCERRKCLSTRGGEGAAEICESESIGLTLLWGLAAGAFFSRIVRFYSPGVLLLIDF